MNARFKRALLIRKIRARAVFCPTHKRTKELAPVWGSEFTTKAATTQGASAEIAATLNVTLWVLILVTGGVACYPFSGATELNPLFEPIWTFENNFESSPKNLAREI
jgi:hypothetical protein